MLVNLHRCRRSVDCFLIDRSICHGRYRRSMLIHLLENTVDIDGRYRFTYLRIRSILTVDSNSPTWKYGRYRIDHWFQTKIGRNRPSMWIRTKKKSVDRVIPQGRKKGPLTYGPIRDEKWSQTHIHQEFMVPCVVRNGPNTYPNMDTYPPIYRPGRSVTVDIDGRCRFTNGRTRSISTVDADLPTENYGRSSIVD